MSRTIFGTLVLLLALTSAHAEPDLAQQVAEIETYLHAHPKRAAEEFDRLAATVRSEPRQDRFFELLHGQALILAGRTADALALAGRIAADAAAHPDDLTLACALLLRSRVQLASGDAAKANALAAQAHELAGNSSDTFLRYWAATTLGISARGLGRQEEALASLQEALSLAEATGSALRRSNALYQLSVLYLALRRPQDALAASLDAYMHAEVAGSAYGTANARMAESAVMEFLEDPARELQSMEEALAIARRARSQTIESKALINLADIRLRRREFRDALELSRRSLALASAYGDTSFVATSKANMGFALFGLGRVADGKRLADEALADYERSGATAEIASLLAEYGLYLERAGDTKGALALFHRERKLHDEIAQAARERALVEIQEKYESGKRRREIELLNRENALKSAELDTRELQQRIWWLLASAFALSFAIVAALYRKLRVTNRLLAERNSELSVRSSRDPLTSLYNRRYFQDFMREDHARSERRRRPVTDKATKALLLIDIDHFKAINDRHGHAAGDAVLVVVARRLRETLRETDVIVRWGGEEFLVFVPATDRERLDEIAMRIMHAIAAQPVLFQGTPIRVTASVGYAPMPLPPHNLALPWDRALGLIDMALYMAKVHGRNRAYGIRGVRQGDTETLARIEQDLEQSWRDGMVEMQALPGPEFYVYPATASMPGSDRARH